MFDIGWSELLVVAVVAIVVIGPRDLPTAMRTLGRALGGVRRMASDFRSQFDDAMREAELDDLRKEITGLRDIARGIVQQNDVSAIAQNELNDIQSSLESKEATLEAKEAEAEAADAYSKADEIAADDGQMDMWPVGETEAIEVADSQTDLWPVADVDAIEAAYDSNETADETAPVETAAADLPPADAPVGEDVIEAPPVVEPAAAEAAPVNGRPAEELADADAETHAEPAPPVRRHKVAEGPVNGG